MEGQFKVGDVVQLKSGGPGMTITDIQQQGDRTQVGCQWFDGTKPESGVFRAEVLKEYKAPSARAIRI